MTETKRNLPRRLMVVGCCGIALSHAAWGAGGIQTDGSVGANGNWLGRPQSLSGSEVTITQEMGSTAGHNLFHSFADFNVNRGQTVTFTGESALRNVISRVTGNNPSDIDGTLKSTIGTADFYFINPNGVTFGPGARVDVPAAFHVSTADEIKFSDGTRFSAKDLNGSTLSAEQPAAFGYLGTSAINNGLIKVDGAQLEVKSATPGQTPSTIDLVGGQIRIENGARIAAGERPDALAGPEVRIAAVKGAMEVPIRPAAVGESPVPTADNAGNIDLSSGTVEIRGDGGGRIDVWGGDIMLSGGSRIGAVNDGPIDHGRITGIIDVHARNLALNGSAVASSTSTGVKAADIKIDVAENLTLTDGGTIGSSAESGDGGAGDVTVKANSIQLDQSQIASSAKPASRGNTGSIVIAAGRSLKISGGSAISIDSDAQDANSSKAGQINITAHKIALDNGRISARTSGNQDGGTISINEGRNSGKLSLKNGSEISASTSGTARAGDIDIRAGRVNLKRSTISASADRLSSGQTGTVAINARTSIELARRSGISIETASTGENSRPAALGQLTLNAKRIVLRNQSELSADIQASNVIRAGSVKVTGRNLVLDASTISARTSAPADGGGIDIEVEGALQTQRGSEITASSSGTGYAGNVKINASRLLLNDTKIASTASFTDSGAGSITVHKFGNGRAGRGTDLQNTSIFTTSEAGPGGEISIQRDDSIKMENSRIASSVNSGTGQGGNINVRGKALEMRASDIQSEAESGPGGRITIRSETAVSLTGSHIASSVNAGQGNGGDISVGARTLTMNGSSIKAEAFSGRGGAIDIRAPDAFLASADSVVSAVSKSGVDGPVLLEPQLNLSGILANLGTPAFDVSHISTYSCPVTPGSTLSVEGKGGLPARARDWKLY